MDIRIFALSLKKNLSLTYEHNKRVATVEHILRKIRTQQATVRLNFHTCYYILQNVIFFNYITDIKFLSEL